MNVIDLLILVILISTALTGYFQGFVVELALLFGAVIALAVAKAGYLPMQQVLHAFAPKGPGLKAVSYLLVFLIVWGAVVALARIIRRVLRLLLLGLADRLAGAVLGFLEGVVLVETLLYLGKRSHNADLVDVISRSRLASRFIDVVPYLHHLLPSIQL